MSSLIKKGVAKISALASIAGAAMVGTSNGRTAQKEIDSLSISSEESNSGYLGLLRVASSAVILGDSITEGSGAGSYANGYALQVARSIANELDNGPKKDRGFGWHVEVNQANAQHTGYTTTGTPANAGMVGARLTLEAGQSVNITQREFNSVYVIYNGAASSGSLVIAKNGATLSTQATSGAGLNSTEVVANAWNESDTLTITASGGSVQLCAVHTLRTAQAGALVYVAGKSGFALQDFTSAAALDEIAYYLNFLRGGNEKMIVLNLGTNNLYNAGKAKTPAATVAEIQALITGINARCSNVKYVLAVPPKANEGIFPITSAGFSYVDYVDAITEAARDGGHGVIRHDQTILSRKTSFYGDGVHPNVLGHRIMAAMVCKTLGVRLNPYTRTANPPAEPDTQTDIVMGDTWGPFTGSAALKAKAHIEGNQVTLSGIVQKNGSVSTTIGTIPSGYRPLNRTCYMIGRNDAGAAPLQIDTAGNIVVSAVPASWVSLEGITFAVTRT